jgi:gas vesicle protein
MDDGERQYWIDVLPIMSEDQVQNLREILDNEKKQLAEAAAAYSEGMQKEIQNVANEFDEEAYKEKKRARLEAEKLHEKEEREHEAAVLEELKKL